MRSKTDLRAMTYGIEIECNIPRSTCEWEHGNSIPNFPGWKMKHDGSIMPPHGFESAEIITPDGGLRGPEGFDQIRRMLAKLRAMGTTTNQSCGFHIHIGWNGSPAQLRRLICLFAHHEKAFFAANGSKERDQNTYCQSIQLSHAGLQRLRTMRDLRDHYISGGGRYRALNLTNLSSGYGNNETIEFRLFAGTLDETRILANIALCLGLTQKALDSNGTIAWNATRTEAQTKSGIKDGALAMRKLITQLNFWTKGKRAPYGIFDPAILPSITSKLRDLASAYDADFKTYDGY